MIDEAGRLREALDLTRSARSSRARTKWYVSITGGAAINSGRTPEEPLNTINAAIAAADDGDIIHIAEDTYDEAVSIPAGKNGLSIICEPGVYLINTTPGTVVAIASAVVYWEGGILETFGQTAMEVNGDWFIGKDIRAYNSTIGFDMNAPFPLMINCKAILCTSAGFDISEDSGHYIECAVNGAAASRGFYLSHTNAENNVFHRCDTLGCTAAGYETVAGADDNLFSHCSQSSLCAGPTDAGANNTWVFSEGSQIVAGQSRDQDLKDIFDRIGGASTEATYSLPNDLVENTVVTITPTGAQRITFKLDLSNLVQNADVRVRYDMHGDGAPFPVEETFNWTVGMEDIVYFREVSGQRAVVVTVQSLVVQGAAKDIDYEYVLG